MYQMSNPGFAAFFTNNTARPTDILRQTAESWQAKSVSPAYREFNLLEIKLKTKNPLEEAQNKSGYSAEMHL